MDMEERKRYERDRILEWAKEGAIRRLGELETEMAEILQAFPGIQRERRRASLAANAAKARAVRAQRLSERQPKEPSAGEDVLKVLKARRGRKPN